MSGQRRQRDAQGWRDVMERFDVSATTVEEFCAREGLSSSSFYRWRERLRRCATPAVARRARVSGVAVSAPSGFIDLGDLADPSSRTQAGLQVRLELGGGVVLHITRA